ncbi:MAG: DUF3627 domain-containing protein [Bacteroidetes bacterium]|nr:DUF3627 domain-containing protein [Bacteroidota bacterium]
MKKLICILVAFATLSVTLPAQAQQERKTPPTPEQRAERRANHLKSQLVLTEEQYAQVKAAALKIENERISKDTKKKAGDDFEVALKGILNPEQMEKFMSMKEERKEKVKAKMEEKRNEDKTKSEGAVEDKKD